MPFSYHLALFITAVLLQFNLVLSVNVVPCTKCSNNCPAKGQFLFNLETVLTTLGANSQAIYKQFTSLDHPGWQLTSAYSDAMTPKLELISGPKWTVNYIISIYYTSPDLGIVGQDIYLDAPDVCTQTGSTTIFPSNTYYATVYQRRDAARRSQLCLPSSPKSRHIPVIQFPYRNFAVNNDISALGGQFTARYDDRLQMVKLTVAESNFERNLYPFEISILGKSPFKMGLYTGESCYYALPRAMKASQDYIRVSL
jgi:hypothetical protein